METAKQQNQNNCKLTGFYSDCCSTQCCHHLRFLPDVVYVVSLKYPE